MASGFCGLREYPNDLDDRIDGLGDREDYLGSPAYRLRQSDRGISSIAMSRRPVLPQLYSALLKMSLLRDEVTAFGDDLEVAETARYMARIHELETKAVRLLDRVETSKSVCH
jgi:hypothetical protein